MTEHDVATRLRAALESKAESAMTLTDTDRELDRLRRRLPATTRRRRLRITAAGAAVAAAAAGIVVAVQSSGDNKPSPPTPGNGPWTDKMPREFPLGTYAHPGTFGRTVLNLTADAQAKLSDPRDSIPTVMAMQFQSPDLVRFTVVKVSSTTVQCDHTTATFTYVVSGGELTLTPQSDPCGLLRIPLSEKPWGPVTRTVGSDGFPTGTFMRPGSQPPTTLELSVTGAVLRRPQELLSSELSFPATGQVQFTCSTGPHAPCASPCLYRYTLTGQTLQFELVRKSALCRTDDYVARGPWRRTS